MRLRSLALISAVSFLPIASTCPTADPFPPPQIIAPSFTLMEVTGVKSGGAYRAAVHMQWKLGTADSFPVKSFVVLKKASGDSAFGIMHYGIPDTVFDDYDIINAKDLPQYQLFGNPYSAVKYLVFAVDTLGRSGDTSAADSILLTWPPTLTYPLDTLNQNLFTWQTSGYQGGYYANMVLWGGAGLVWSSPIPSSPRFGNVALDSFNVQLPSALYPLQTGQYYYGVVVTFPGVNIESIIIRGFYAP